MKRWMGWMSGASFLVGLIAAWPTRALDAPTHIELYALDGGRLELPDMSMFSDTGEFDGKSGKLAVPAFLIRHPKGTLLWDTGLSDALAKSGGATMPNGIKMTVEKSVIGQLAEIGLAPKDVQYVAFSHLHGDHTGNANAFTSAQWIVSKKELAWARSKPTPGGVDLKTISALTPGKQLSDDFDHDVFGDGRVRILRAPGHTPDHRVLLLKLDKAGTTVLSGDLYHTREAAQHGLVPMFNVSRADSLASFDRVSKLIKQNNARLIVQHVPEDFASLPKFPAHLE